MVKLVCQTSNSPRFTKGKVYPVSEVRGSCHTVTNEYGDKANAFKVGNNHYRHCVFGRYATFKRAKPELSSVEKGKLKDQIQETIMLLVIALVVTLVMWGK